MRQINYSGKNARTVNYLRTIYFDRPLWTCCTVSMLPATWMKYREHLEELVLSHPKVFPGFVKGARNFDVAWSRFYEPGHITDCWGCTWENVHRGMDGAVIGHPLANWDDFESGRWQAPDPMKETIFGTRDWQKVRDNLDKAQRRGDLRQDSVLPHGFQYMTLYYLRGFDNFLMDLALDEPRLAGLIKIVEDYNVAVVGKFLELGIEMLGLAEDLGLQRSLPMSPAMWRRYIKPSYERIMGPARDRGIPVRLHSDGHILEIIDDLVEVGVRLLNGQLRANGIEGLQRVAKGKVALDQDLDRQLFPFATPAQIAEHVGQVHEALYDPRGGLMLFAEFSPDVPLENIDAVCSAMERICRLPEPGKEPT